MSDKIVLNVKKREVFGRKVKNLRKKNIVPANIFGSKIKSLAIQVSENDFKKTYEKAGETNIIYLKVDGESKEKPTLIVGTQTDPISQKILHADFRQVDLTQKVSAQVELELKGESPAEQAGAVIVTLKDSIEIEALPMDLPEKIEINIASIEKIGDSISVSDLNVDTKKVEILDDKEEILVQAEEKQKEVVEEETPTKEEGEEEGEQKEESEDKKEGGEEKPVEKKEEKKD